MFYLLILLTELLAMQSGTLKTKEMSLVWTLLSSTGDLMILLCGLLVMLMYFCTVDFILSLFKAFSKVYVMIVTILVCASFLKFLL